MSSWKDLKNRYFTPEEQARIKTEALEELALVELRQARQMSQAALADILGVKQPTIARMERRTDMYLSSLRGMIQAMGGDLEIVARFPDGAVRINQFHGIEESGASPAAAALAQAAAEATESYRPAKRRKRKPAAL